jgi:CRP-like cAMP-binding protein
MSRRVETLSKIRLFASVDTRSIDRLNSQCAWHTAQAGEWILDYGQASNEVFFVTAGSVQVRSQFADREVFLRQIEAGGHFGELAAIDGKPRSAGIIAVTAVTVARMPDTVFRAAIHEHASVCDHLLTMLTGQIRMLANRVNEFTILDVRHRIQAELLRLARPDKENARQAIISPPPTHADIASRVSTRREAVTRELAALERSGLLVRRRGAMVLPDVTALRRRVEVALDGE